MISINERWAVAMEPDCIVLIKKAICKETGKPKVDKGSRRYYYPNWEATLSGLVDRDFDSDLTTLDDIVGRIEELKSHIARFLVNKGIQRAAEGTSPKE
jgi:hypothetical protein